MKMTMMMIPFIIVLSLTENLMQHGFLKNRKIIYLYIIYIYFKVIIVYKALKVMEVQFI